MDPGLCALWDGKACRRAPVVDNPGNSSGTTGQLSTQNGDGPKLLSASPALCADRHTDFAAAQPRANIEQIGLVHRKWLALLLLLFIYRTIEE